MPFNDYQDYSKLKYSSLNNLFDEILRINENSLILLEGLTESLVTSERFVTINITDRNGNPMSYSIPSVYALTGIMNNLRDQLLVIQKSKILDYTDPTQYENIKIFSEPNTIRIIPQVDYNTLSINNNPIFDLFQEKLFQVDIDLSQSVSPLSKHVKILKYVIPINSLKIDFDINDANVNNRTQLESYLDTNSKFTKSEYVIALDSIKVEQSGEYRVDQILNVSTIVSPIVDVFGNLSNTMLKADLLLNNSIVNNNVDKTSRSIAADDILVNKYNFRYKVLPFENRDYRYNEYTITTLSDSLLPAVGDTLHIASDVLVDRKFKHNINSGSIEILYFKDISPNIKIEGATYTSVPIILDPRNITTTGMIGEEISIYDYQVKYLYDYVEWLTEGVKMDMRIPASAGIKPDAPILIEDNFRVVRQNGHRFSSDNPIIDQLLSSLTFYNSRLQSLEAKKIKLQDDMAKWLSQGNTTTDPNYLEMEHSLSDLNLKIMDANLQINELKTKIIEQDFELEAVINSKYVVEGMWEMVQPKVDARGRNQDVIQYEVEYSYMDLGKEPNCTPSFNFRSIDGSIIKTIFPKQRYIKSVVREKRFNDMTGRHEWEYVYKPGDTLDMFNRIEIPINPYEIVMIRVRSISEAGWPNQPLHSDWSNPVYMEFPQQFINIIDAENNKRDIVNSLKEDNQWEQQLKSLMDEIVRLREELAQKTQSIWETKIFQVAQCNLNTTCPIAVLPARTVEHTLQVIDEKLGIFLMPNRDTKVSRNGNGEIEVWMLQPYISGLQINDLIRINFNTY